MTRDCIRGCVTFEVGEDGKRQPLHYAACTNPETCRGCVHREAADHALICTPCIGRAKRLIADAPELLQRVRGKILQVTSGAGGDGSQRTRASHPSSRWEGDPLDAVMALQAAIGADVGWLSNDTEGVEWLSRRVLDRHKPAEDGTRDVWSVQDVMDRWGLEDRPEPHRHVYPDDSDNAEEVMPVTEWYDPLIDVKQAADRAGVGVREVQRWVSGGLIQPAARVRQSGAMFTYLRASEVDALAQSRSAERKRTFSPRGMGAKS